MKIVQHTPWISISEQLPPLYKDVLTLNIKHEILIMRREEDGWAGECCGCDWDERTDMTHWQYLPELPEGPQ